MHVGIICEHSDPTRGGAERYLEALATRLRAHGHEVTVRARKGPHAYPVATFPAALKPWHYGRTFLPQLREAGVERVLATAPVPGCDFYQPHNGILGVSVPAHLDPLPAGLRHLRAINPYRLAHFGLLRTFEAAAVEPPTTVLALSPRIVTDLARFYPDARAKLHRPGVDLRRFSPGPKGDAGPLLLFVANNYRLKGLHTALRALELLPDARLVVVGNDTPVPADRVEYLKRVDDIAELYRRADVLVHPTWYDTAALVVLEALASGTPAISTTRDGNSDLAVEGGGVALTDPGDADALAAAVREVVAGASAERARAVAERFDVSRMLDEVVETITCASSS